MKYSGVLNEDQFKTDCSIDDKEECDDHKKALDNLNELPLYYQIEFEKSEDELEDGFAMSEYYTGTGDYISN